MKDSSLSRLRVYLNYGLIGFIISLVLLLFGEGVMFGLPFLFNLTLFKKLFSYSSKLKYLGIGIISTLITTLFFLIQQDYRRVSHRSCIDLIQDWDANFSYASTMVLFSIIFWEIGFFIINKKKVLSFPK